MKRASYRDAIRWIATNVYAEQFDEHETTTLVAYIFEETVERVARDVTRFISTDVARGLTSNNG